MHLKFVCLLNVIFGLNVSVGDVELEGSIVYNGNGFQQASVEVIMTRFKRL